MTRAARVLPPALPQGSIARPALEERLSEATARRLTTVTAGAGFGKTTLLAAWGGRLGCAWYTIDRSDVTVGALGSGIASALQARVPGLATHPAATDGGAGSTPAAERGRAEVFASHLSEALQGELSSDLILVLDEVQELDPRSPAVRVIEALCRHAPDRLHVVLASRADPPFPIERLRGRGLVLALDPSALAGGSALALDGDRPVGLRAPRRGMARRLAHDAGLAGDRRRRVTGRWRRRAA